MLGANNTVTNTKQKEKKYSLSTVLAWLYLKTIGRILPESWNKWAESILHYNIVNNVVQTDALKAVDQSVQVSGEIIFQDITMQTECAEIKDQNFQASLESEKEKELKDENEKLKEKLKEVDKKEENQLNLNQELTKKEKEVNELTEQVKLLEAVFTKFFAVQAQHIEDLQLENDFLEMDNEDLKSKLTELKKNYRELAEIAQKRDEEFLAQLKEKSEKILHLQKELINLSAKFANEKERLSVELGAKDSKINNLMRLNKESDKDRNEQKQIIFDQEKKIKEQDDLINSFHDNKNINEVVKEENKSLRVQKIELESKVSKLKNESKTQNENIKQLKHELEQQRQVELKITTLQEQAKEKDAEVENLKECLEKDKNDAEKKKKDLESKITTLQKQAEKKNAELEDLKQQLEREKSDLEGKLKDSSSKLSAAEIEKKELESKITSLQEQVQSLEKGKEWESAGIDDSLKKTSLDLTEMLKEELAKQEKQIEQLQKERKQAEYQAKADITKLQEEKKGLLDQIDTLKKNLPIVKEQLEKQLLLNNQEQQKLKNELEDINKETKELDAISIASNAKSTTGSSRSIVSKIFKDSKNLDNFLSDQNVKLKEKIPEFKNKHFCHNVLKKTIQSLQYQNDYKFKSDELLALLKENFVKSGRAIIETKVNKVVEEVAKTFVKKHDLTQTDFCEKCAKKLEITLADYQVELTSTVSSWSKMSCRDNDSVKKFVVEGLTKAKMELFSTNIEIVAPSIRDTFISPDYKMCIQTSEKNNEYQLTEIAQEEYKSNEVNHMPNSSMSYSNTTNVSKGRFK